MKAISIQQPWAWAIMHAGKDIENRAWSTTYRGEVAIHATRLQESWRLPRGVQEPLPGELVQGALLGVVDLVDVVTRSSSAWFTGPVGFLLSNPRPLPRPIPCKGNLRIWQLPTHLATAMRTKMAGALRLPTPKDQAMESRLLSVTQGNVANNHFSLRGAIDLFAADALGATKDQAGRPVRVLWGSETVETDIVKSRQIFRRRGWVAKFFAQEGIVAGDRILLEHLGPDEYRVSKART